MKIGNKIIKNHNPCFIIAEIGTAHMGSADKAFELIDAAKEAGADCAKFQIVFADEIIHPKTGKVKLPGGDTDLYKSFRSLERGKDFYKELKIHAEKSGLVFLCTPFGIKSARILKSLNVDAIKIASPELNHFPLLKEVSRYNCPLILSTGVSKLKDIENALAVVSNNCNNTAILHCITSYPAPEQEFNLKVISSLAEILGVPVGISDHSADPYLVPVIGAGLGACIIEKHLTLSNNNKGLDDPYALREDKFKEMVKQIRKIEAFKAELIKIDNTNYQQNIIEKLKSQFDTAKVEGIIGTGIKKLAESEKDNYETTRRSLKAMVKINKRELITKDNISILRSEQNLTPGMSPKFFDIIFNKRAKKTIQEGEGISWKHII